MKILLLLFLISRTILCQAQDEMSVERICSRGITGYQAQYRTAILVVKRAYGKKTITSYGAGFILKNKYIATCYHVYNDSGKIIEVKVLYNIKHINVNSFNDHTYDSVYATLDYKTNKDQYDFKKHIYKQSERETDIIILKLSKKIRSLLSSIDNSEDTKKIKLVSTGFSIDHRSGTINFESSEQDVVDIWPYQNFLFYSSLGLSRAGYSGSPCFNEKGDIVAMTQMRVNTEYYKSELLKYYNRNRISKTEYDQMVETGITDPDFGINISIGISILLKKYLKGYY